MKNDSILFYKGYQLTKGFRTYCISKDGIFIMDFFGSLKAVKKYIDELEINNEK